MLLLKKAGSFDTFLQARALLTSNFFPFLWIRLTDDAVSAPTSTSNRAALGEGHFGPPNLEIAVRKPWELSRGRGTRVHASLHIFASAIEIGAASIFLLLAPTSAE